MKAWVLKLFHAIGLTNLTDQEVARYDAVKKLDQMTFTDLPIITVRSSVIIHKADSKSALSQVHG